MIVLEQCIIALAKQFETGNTSGEQYPYAVARMKHIEATLSPAVETRPAG